MQILALFISVLVVLAPLFVALLIYNFLVAEEYGNLRREPKRTRERQRRRANTRRRQQEINNKWEQAQRTHDDLNNRWHAYETNLQDILANPLMRNLEDPTVAEAVRAMGRADALRTKTPPRVRNRSDMDDAINYITAVNDYELAFNAAQRKAETHQLDDFATEERKKIQRARDLLTLALDTTGASSHERQTAYKQVLKLIAEVRLSVPQEAIDNLELQAVGRRGITS